MILSVAIYFFCCFGASCLLSSFFLIFVILISNNLLFTFLLKKDSLTPEGVMFKKLAMALLVAPNSLAITINKRRASATSSLLQGDKISFAGVSVVSSISASNVLKKLILN